LAQPAKSSTTTHRKPRMSVQRRGVQRRASARAKRGRMIVRCNTMLANLLPTHFGDVYGRQQSQVRRQKTQSQCRLPCARNRITVVVDVDIDTNISTTGRGSQPADASNSPGQSPNSLDELRGRALPRDQEERNRIFSDAVRAVGFEKSDLN